MDLPKIGFGTWKISPDATAELAVIEALNAGYRLIDTAMIYGNEKGVGAAINATDIPREEIYLTTKLWNSDQGYDTALRALDASLQQLGQSYIDLYLIHWPQSQELSCESWKALEKVHSEGLAKNIGVSNFDVQQLNDLLDMAHVRPVVNQIEFHPFIYETQKPIIEFCRNNGITVEAYSPLSRGKALDHQKVAEVAKNIGKTNGQVMLRWAIEHGTVPIPKTSHKERMIENLGIFDFELSKEQMQELNSLSSDKSFL